jgi:uncharacterized lipoprotein YmbA
MKISNPLLLLLFLFITGCSSAPEQHTQYYLLYNHSAALMPAPDKSLVSQPIKIEVTMPAYLNQPNLVIKLSEHNLHFALHHQWAEPLKQGFYKSLISDINQTERYKSLISAVKTSMPTLNVTIEHFHITENSMVILSGHYGYSNSTTSSIARFDLRLPLELDGYEHAVAQLRSLITQLAIKIAARE